MKYNSSLKGETDKKLQRDRQKPHKYSKSAATSVPKNTQGNGKGSDFNNPTKKVYTTNITGSVKVDTNTMSGGIRKKLSTNVQKAGTNVKKTESVGEKRDGSFGRPDKSKLSTKLPDSIVVPDSNELKLNQLNKNNNANFSGKNSITENITKPVKPISESSHKRIKSDIHGIQPNSDTQLRDNPYKRAIKVICNKRKEAANKKASELYQSLQNPVIGPLAQGNGGEAKASTSISSPLEGLQSSADKVIKTQPKGGSGRDHKIYRAKFVKKYRYRKNDIVF